MKPLLTAWAVDHPPHPQSSSSGEQMVILNGKKFACSSCIKGHRSSSCSHTNRTLVEIGKKGRPPTQCSHCRELRRTSKVHSKCVCGDRPSPARQIEILPNGTTSLLKPSPSDAQTDTIQLINQIFNPCSCSNGGPCCCSTPAHPTIGTRANNPKKKNIKSLENSPATSDQPLIYHPPIPSTSRPTCCSSNSTYTESSTSYTPPVTLPSSSTSGTTAALFTPYPTSGSLPLPSNSSAEANCSIPSTDPSCHASSTSNPANFDPLAFSTEPTLFAPQTAGTALCFCGIHCPCPGCALHDPLGLKFRTNSNNLCPTSMIIAQDCIAGLDLPTVNQLLNLTPMIENFPKPSTETESPPPVVNLPSVSQTFGIPSLSTSTELSLSQTSSYLMMGQSSTSTACGSSSNYKSSRFDANILQPSCCGSSSKKNVEEPPNNSDLPSHGCCGAQPKVIQNNNPTGPSGCCSRERNDQGQQLNTLNRFDASGNCQMNPINSPQPV